MNGIQGGLKAEVTPTRALRLDLHIGERSVVDPENWDFKGADTQYLLHNIHPYPARFIPQIPNRAISRWTNPGDLVLDPFCGGGTTLLEALLLGRDSVGVDNNGVATLVATAKIQPYTETDYRDLESLIGSTREALEKPSNFRKGQARLQPISRSPQIPEYEGRRKWFSDQALLDLSWLKAYILQLDPPARTLALAVFSSLIVRASRQDSDTRYSAISRPYAPGAAIGWWSDRMEDALMRARLLQRQRRPSKLQVFTADCRAIPFVESTSVKLVVTSPPYLNAYDYHKYHRHRLHWIGADVAFARDTEIGKHDTFTRPLATPERYFDEMSSCMQEWVRVLKHGGRAFVVVGDAIVSKQFVPVAERLIELGSAHGLGLEKRWVRTLDSKRKSFNPSSRIKREHLLLFQKR